MRPARSPSSGVAPARAHGLTATHAASATTTVSFVKAMTPKSTGPRCRPLRPCSQSAPMLDLVDIGANLTHDSFDRDRAEVLARAAAAGVRRAIVTGASVTGSAQALELAAEHPGVLYATAGVHPHHAADFDAHTSAALGALLADPKVVAVGECGLDYFRDFSPRDAQRRAFQAQLELATSVAKPVFLHERDAHADFVAVLAPLVRDFARGGV